MSEGAAIKGIKKGLNSILGVRDKVALIHRVYMVTRTWSEREIGRGEYRDVEVQMLPSPGIKEFKHDLRVQEGGAVQQGDVLLKGISQVSYPEESDIDCSSSLPGVERFYRIAGKEYTVVNVRERYLTWNVLCRKRGQP